MLRYGYGTLTLVAALAFLGLALLFALTVPYHEWDAFSYGEWSRRIATRGAFDPRPLGPDVGARPVFLVLQGFVWSVTGVSFVAGRLLSLLFAAAAVVGTSFLIGRGRGRQFALLAFLSVPVFATEAISGKTDVPAAAAVACTAAVALNAPFRGQRAALVALSCAAVLTKPSSVVPALCGLALALMLVESPWTRARLVASRSLAVCVGTLLGFAYEWPMAVRYDLGLFAFLRAGTGGYYADLARSLRTDTLLRLDFIGADLRLPLAFALVYAVLRAVRLDHRRAAWTALVVGGVFALSGPFAAGDPHGPFGTPESTFTFVGFALILSAVPFAPPELEPDRIRVVQLLLIALPPTVVWAAFGIYATRLEAPAWPALTALIGLSVACAVRTVHRVAGVASLAAAAVLAVALWGSLVSMDGFHGPMWAEYQSLGVSGVWDRDRTTNIVLPAVSETVDVLEPLIGPNGRLVTSDPHFRFWFENTILEYPTTCSELASVDGFILSTADESQLVMRAAGGSPDPSVWAKCSHPKLRELTDGSNGLAAFVVQR